MLRHDVTAAVEAGRFKVFAVEDVDQAIALLTGIPAGDADENGHFPEGTVNRRVSARPAELTKLRASFARPRRKKPSGKKKRKKEE